MRLLLLAVLAFVVVLCSPARAVGEDLPAAELDFARDIELTACPGVAAFRSDVAAHLGYDPFRNGGKTRVLVRIRRDGPVVVGDVDVLREGEAAPSKKTLRAPSGACDELLRSLALATSLALDPIGERRPPPPAPPAPAPPPPPSPAPASPAPAPLPPAPRVPAAAQRKALALSPYILAGGGFSFGTTPRPSGGPRAAFGLRVARLSFQIDGRFDLPTSVQRPGGGGGLSASMLYVLGAACGHVTPRPPERGFDAAFCAIGGGGPLFANGFGLSKVRSRVDPIAGVGVRVRAAYQLRALGVGLSAEVLATLARPALGIEDPSGDRLVLWQVPAASVSIGPELSLRF